MSELPYRARGWGGRGGGGGVSSLYILGWKEGVFEGGTLTMSEDLVRSGTAYSLDVFVSAMEISILNGKTNNKISFLYYKSIVIFCLKFFDIHSTFYYNLFSYLNIELLSSNYYDVSHSTI